MATEEELQQLLEDVMMQMPHDLQQQINAGNDFKERLRIFFTIVMELTDTCVQNNQLHDASEQNEVVEEAMYCFCRRVAYGDMIACDSGACAIEWFHFDCVNVTVAPEGDWLCPKCVAAQPFLPEKEKEDSEDKPGPSKSKNMKRRLSSEDSEQLNAKKRMKKKQKNGMKMLKSEEGKYCFCGDGEYGRMIGCDGPDCPMEWFHFACVGITSPPKGKWICQNCAVKER